MNLPKRFQFSGVAAGIKPSGKPDLAMVTTDEPAVAVGVYTQNAIRAASIDWNRQVTPTDQFRGLVINSGNANACTGEQGAADNRQMAVSLAGHLGAEESQVCVLSTGVIGRLLPVPNVLAGIENGFHSLGSTQQHFEAASQAILTTDQGPKTAQASICVGGADISIAAMAKGAGMIGPNMATMLAVMTTDCQLDRNTAQSMIKRVANQSFNQISVEGHTSTNDALILIASGAASQNSLTESELDQFESALTKIAVELATKIPADGEGATHLIEISVVGAATDSDADRVARSIANSALVKTAIHGGDPNWGRIVSAAGYCGVSLEPEKISLHINGFELFRGGTPVQFDARQVSESIKTNFNTRIELRLGSGPGNVRHWTSDLTVQYVRFNSEYTT